MATYFAPGRVEKIIVTLNVTLAHDRGQHVREMTFTDAQNGRETINQLADLLLSACDLALSTAKPDIDKPSEAQQLGGDLWGGGRF